MRLSRTGSFALAVLFLISPALAASGDDPFAHVCGGVLPGPGHAGLPLLGGLHTGRSSLLGVCVGTTGSAGPQRSVAQHPRFSQEAVAQLQRWLGHHLEFLHAGSDVQRTRAGQVAAEAKQKFTALRAQGALVFATQQAAAEAFVESSRQHAAAHEGSPEAQLTKLRSDIAFTDLRTMTEDARTTLTLAEVFRQLLFWKERALNSSSQSASATVLGFHQRQMDAMRQRGLTIHPSWALANQACEAAARDLANAQTSVQRALATLKLAAYQQDRTMLAGSVASRD